MANRRYEQFQLSLEKKAVSLYAKVTFGASGAPTLVTSTTIGGLTRQMSKGIASIARNSAGTYTITFGAPSTSTQPAQTDNYYFLMDARSVFVNSTSPASPSMYVKADNSASGNVQIVFNNAGTATDPASGEAVLLHFVLSNSCV